MFDSIIFKVHSIICVCCVCGNYLKKEIILRRNNKKKLTTQLIALEQIIQGQLSKFKIFSILFVFFFLIFRLHFSYMQYRFEINYIIHK